MSNEKLLSSRIKELRTSMGLTQKEFAELINVSTVSVSSYETEAKNPSLEMVINIANKCNVSTDWLCGLSDVKNINNNPETYYDVLGSLVKLCSTKYEDSNDNFIEISYDDFSETIFSIKQDPIVSDFFIAWEKMYKLYYDKTIDLELYKLWLEKELLKYKDHKINGLPF